MTEYFCWFPKKREPSKKHTHNKLSLVTEVDEPQTGSLGKPRRWNTFIVKFQNLKHKVFAKNYLKMNFFFRRNLKQKPSKYHYYVVSKLRKLIYYLNACYLLKMWYIKPKCIGSGIQNTVKLLSVLTLCRHESIVVSC